MINNKAIIEFSFCIIRRIMEISEGVITLQQPHYLRLGLKYYLLYCKVVKGRVVRLSSKYFCLFTYV